MIDRTIKAINFVFTAVAKMTALIILLVGLAGLLCASQMIPYTQRLGSMLHGQCSFTVAAIVWLGMCALLLYVGVTGLLRWRVP